MGWLEESKNYLNSTNEKNIENQILQSKEQIDKQNKEDYVNLFLSDEQIKEELKEQLGKETTDEQLQQYLEENYDSFIPEQYVVRGAKLFCSCGSHERKLNVFKDHAVYTEGFPMVHELDKELEKNITFFGVCSSGDPLLSSQSIKLVRITYDQEGNPIEDVVSGTMCVPFIIGGWRDTKENVKIIDNGDKDSSDKYKYREDSGKGYKAVTTKSFLICRYGGIIEPLDSGQVEIEGEATNNKINSSKKSYKDTVSDILSEISLMGNIGIQSKNLFNTLNTVFEIERKGNYYIIKGLPNKRKQTLNLKEIKGTRYRIGSPKFNEAGLQFYLPKGERSSSGIFKKSIDNFPDAFKRVNNDFLKETFKIETKSLNTLGKLENAFKGLEYFTIGTNMIKSVNYNINNDEDRISEYISDVAIEGGKGIFNMGVAAGCTNIGMAIGTAIPIPVVGTVVGGVLGFGFGYVGGKISEWSTDKLGNLVDNFIDF